MGFTRRHALARAAAAATLASVSFAQTPDPLTDFQITGRVYEPQAISPTDERIAALTLPSGFRIHRYAEGLYNPRILATAPDGTVYVTQRTPGNLVMLKDLDRDGVVDVQKVVHPIRIFALDTALSLPSGFNRHALLEAMDGHVLAKGELIGTFAREP
jgi:glucose/arabinose dehydrogenase